MGVASTDNITARNGTAVTIMFDSVRVGRVQQFRESQNNNVQVLAELGRDYMVEMKKGITVYSFSIASFLCRADALDALRNGKVFSLTVRDEQNTQPDVGTAEVLRSFSKCMITSLDSDYTVGQAAIGRNASVVTIGNGSN